MQRSLPPMSRRLRQIGVAAAAAILLAGTIAACVPKWWREITYVYPPRCPVTCPPGKGIACQDGCAKLLGRGEPCNFSFCSDGKVEQCGPGLTCLPVYGGLPGGGSRLECQDAPRVGAPCVSWTSFACAEGQYCAQPQFKKGDDPRQVPLARCLNRPGFGEPCGGGWVCADGLQCIDGECRRYCESDYDCPCSGGGRLCCDGICRGTSSTFAAVRRLIFEDGRCVTCHSGSKPKADLNLHDGDVYQQLLQAATTVPSWKRVTPGFPDTSLLYRNVAARTLGTPLPAGGDSMPPNVAGYSAVPPASLEILRKWIAAGAPRDSIVAGTEQVVRVCQPTATPTPSPTPTPMVPQPTATPTPYCPPLPAAPWARLIAPPWLLPKQTAVFPSEREVCYATYYDISASVPAANRVNCPADLGGQVNGCARVDATALTMANSHHSIIAAFPTSMVNDPSWGTWRCLAGPDEGLACNPLMVGTPATQGGADCGAPGACAATDWVCETDNLTPCNPRQPNPCGRCLLADRKACHGWGPGFAVIDPRKSIGGGQDPATSATPAPLPPDVYRPVPIKGIVVWNSHSYNGSQDDVRIGQCYDVRISATAAPYVMQPFSDFSNIFVMTVKPFETQEVCGYFTFPKDAHLIGLSSHMHKRGVRFRIWDQPHPACPSDNTGCAAPAAPPAVPPIYENLDYEHPLVINPNLCFGAANPDQRTVMYCAVYDNGFPNDVSVVKRNSTSPSPCTPTRCVEGVVAKDCTVNTDCDMPPTSGVCDACVLKGGATTDDEMMVPGGVYYIGPPCP